MTKKSILKILICSSAPFFIISCGNDDNSNNNTPLLNEQVNGFLRAVFTTEYIHESDNNTDTGAVVQDNYMKTDCSGFVNYSLKEFQSGVYGNIKSFYDLNSWPDVSYNDTHSWPRAYNYYHYFDAIENNLTTYTMPDDYSFDVVSKFSDTSTGDIIVWCSNSWCSNTYNSGDTGHIMITASGAQKLDTTPVGIASFIDEQNYDFYKVMVFDASSIEHTPVCEQDISSPRNEWNASKGCYDSAFKDTTLDETALKGGVGAGYITFAISKSDNRAYFYRFMLDDLNTTTYGWHPTPEETLKQNIGTKSPIKVAKPIY